MSSIKAFISESTWAGNSTFVDCARFSSIESETSLLNDPSPVQKEPSRIFDSSGGTDEGTEDIKELLRLRTMCKPTAKLLKSKMSFSVSMSCLDMH